MWKGIRAIVCSRTLTSATGAELWSDDVPRRIAELKSQPGKDLWIFGGGDLFAQLLEAGVVDDIEVAIVPVLLGGGIPLRALPSAMQRLTLTTHTIYKKPAQSCWNTRHRQPLETGRPETTEGAAAEVELRGQRLPKEATEARDGEGQPLPSTERGRVGEARQGTCIGDLAGIRSAGSRHRP